MTFLQVRTAREGLETAIAEKERTEAKLKSKSRELVDKLLSPDEFQAIKVMCASSPNARATLTQMGIASSIADALLEAFAEDA